MSQKTFFELLGENVIGATETRKSSDMAKIDKNVKAVCEDLPEDTGNSFFKLPEDYLFITNPLFIPIHKNNIIPVDLGNNETSYVPKFFKNRPKHLKEYFNVIKIKGKLYSKDHPEIVKADDTGNYIFKKDAYRVPYSGGYVEEKGNLVYIDRHDFYAKKSDCVEATDTGQLELRNDCRSYTNADGEKEYYFYRHAVPGSSRVVFFDESRFPEKDSLNQTMFGIELEYENAEALTKEILFDKEMRKIWSSTRDGSLPNADSSSAELVSIPLRIDELVRVEEAMTLAKKLGAEPTERCGFHVHFGTPKLNYTTLTSLVVLANNIEDEIFKAVPTHRHNSRFCRKLDSSFEGFIKEWVNEKETADRFYGSEGLSEVRHGQSKWRVDDRRHYWFNIDRYWYKKDEPEKRTVEFRLHHATHDIDDFTQFILLCYYIVEYALNNKRSDCRVADLDAVLGDVKDYRHQVILEEFVNTKIKNK